MENHLELEQLSDLLDGEAAPDLRAHAESCAECGRRLDRLQEARAVVATEVTLPAAAIDAAVAAGVAALSPTNVSSLTRRRRNPLPWLAGAAAALVAVLGLAAVINRDTNRNDTLAGGAAELEAANDSGASGTGGSTAGEDGGDSIESLADDDAAGGGRSQAAADAPTAAARNAFDSEEQVIAYLRESADAMATTATSCSAEASTALGVPLEQLRSEDVSWQEGSAALWVDPAQRRALLMRPAECSILADLRY